MRRPVDVKAHFRFLLSMNIWSHSAKPPSMRRPVDVKAHFRFLLSMNIWSHSAKPPLSPSFHPHSFVSDIRPVLGGCSCFSRYCYLIIVLSSHRFCGSRAPGLSRSHLDSAVELSCSVTNSKRLPAQLSGYCAVVRTPLRLPTTDGAVPPAFEPLPRRLASWHFFLLAPQASVPISADHCLLQKAPECNALPAPSSFADTGLLLC